MSKQLIIALLAASGLAACGEERAVQTSPAVPSAVVPAQPIQAAAPSASPAQAGAAGEKKNEPKSEPEGKGDVIKAQEENKKDEGGK